MPRLTLFATHLHTGGAERVFVNLAAGLVACGAQVEVVLVRAEGAMLALLPPGIPVVGLGGRTACAAPALARHLLARRPGALIAFLEQANIAAVIARRLAWRWSGRLAITEHACFSQHRLRPHSWSHRATLALAPLAYRDADVLIGVSEGATGEWRARLGDRVACRTIHNPVVDDAFSARMAAPAPHPWFTDGAPPLIAVGRLSPEKDQATLLRALAEPRLAACRLVVVGDGPERQRLEALAAGLGLGARVAFTGALADPLPAIARAALLINPSRYEGFGNVLVEALACGTPVVATDCPFGPHEILGGGRWGGLVPVGDPAALAAGIAAALAAPRDRANLQARAQHFHQRRIAGRYLALLGRRAPG